MNIESGGNGAPERVEEAARGHSVFHPAGGCRPVDGETVLMAVHDLRNSLQVILGYAEILLGEPRRTSRRNGEAADRVRGAAVAALHLTRDLAAAASTQSRPAASVERVDLVALLADTAKAFEFLAQSQGVAVLLCRPSRPLCALGDPFHLRRVLENLLINAIGHSPAGGSVRLTARAEDGHAVIEVADAGCGFRPGEGEQLFRPFYRGERSGRPGMGLGLHIVREIAQRHGGSVTARSAGAGRGATFWLRLPLWAEGAEWARIDRPAAPELRRRPLLYLARAVDWRRRFALLAAALTLIGSGLLCAARAAQHSLLGHG